MNKSIFVKDFNSQKVFEVTTSFPYNFESASGYTGKISGFGQRFKSSVFAKKNGFVAFFYSSNKLFFLCNNLMLDVTEKNYEFKTEYVGLFRIKFEVLLENHTELSILYFGSKAELSAAPMDENIFQEVKTRLKTKESKQSLVGYLNRADI
jgi:hypothetical protein